ncbi:MAG: 8-oxo-dGTP diphosphatase [Lachnospiraceae bacterium]|nr:8-oxo-dGTP diphosphatase [Candidatus Colinaster scatohippi]
MLNTTLCYIEKDNKYLMLHRVKKENDLNKDKWVGIGGKFEENETPDECMLREAYEETGLTLTEYRLRGVITFLSNEYEGEYMYLYTATGYKGDIKECNEGNLEWVPINEVTSLPIWEGDKLFFEELIRDRGFFTMKLRYEGNQLVESDYKLHN